MEEYQNPLLCISLTAKVSTAVAWMFRTIMFALPVAQITIGSIYLNSCPVQHYIPIYLIVSGVFSLVMDFLSFFHLGNEAEEVGSNARGGSTMCNGLLSLFMFCWFITGNVWIYSIYQPNYDEQSGVLYCNKTLYLFAFWSTILVCIGLGILLLVGCCFLCGCVIGASIGLCFGFSLTNTNDANRVWSSTAPCL
ncbi:transmembrane protein 272-like [Polypterus senegalus]|uniref:transmembrane protein 272-like n=1 Tax=Polypterus senegalus TaxID=55291 RepID=UPI001963FDE5|nr:transmembrane protein 272-like [Polypterus senegalus]XP_039603297.1 transmembrane protein 272-like [Polypterus senegalus]